MRMSWMMKRAVVLFLALNGCSAEYWAGAYKASTRFDVAVGGARVHFEDSKNNDIWLKDAIFDPVTKQVKIGWFHLRNNGSEVVRATGERADAVARAQMTQVSYVQAVTAGISQIIGAAGSAAPGIIKSFIQKMPTPATAEEPLSPDDLMPTTNPSR